MAGDVLTRKDWPGRWHMGPCGDSGLSPQGNGALLRGFTKQGDDMIILAFRKGSSWPLSGEAWEGGQGEAYTAGSERGVWLGEVEGGRGVSQVGHKGTEAAF